MGVTAVVRRIALASPPIGRWALRSYLKSVGHVPERFEWLVDGLKRDLPVPWAERLIPLDGGGQLYIDGRSAIGREIYYAGSYEPLVAGALKRWLTPGMTFLDAGANIGEFSVRASRLVGPSGHVHAFEASPTTFADLSRNLAVNRVTNVTANQMALTSTSGPIEFFMSRGIASGSSSLRPAHDYSGSTVSVPGITLDDYCAQAGISRVDFIKMDIEGAELEAFRGATRLLSSPDAPVMVFEHHAVVAKRFGVGKEDVQAFLGQFGYRLTRLGSSAGSPARDDANIPQNILALPPHRLTP
jgi:FkbM family methyltransferase